MCFYADQSNLLISNSHPKEGEDVKFTCDSTSHPTWVFNEQALPSNTEIKEFNVLYLKSVTRSNQGYFECMGINEDGDTFFARHLLKVIGKFCYINYYPHAQASRVM